MSVKLPTAPRWIGGLTKKSLFSPLKKFKKFFNKGTYNKKKTSYFDDRCAFLQSSTMDPAWPVICCKLKLKIRLFHSLFCCKRQTVPFLFFLFFFFSAVGKIGKYVQFSLSIYISPPLQAGVSLSYPSSSCPGSNPAELGGSYGVAGVNVGTTIVLAGKDFFLPFSLGYSKLESLR